MRVDSAMKILQKLCMEMLRDWYCNYSKFLIQKNIKTRTMRVFLYPVKYSFYPQYSGTWNRTKINGFKGHCPTIRRSPSVGDNFQLYLTGQGIIPNNLFLFLFTLFLLPFQFWHLDSRISFCFLSHLILIQFKNSLMEIKIVQHNLIDKSTLYGAIGYIY